MITNEKLRIYRRYSGDVDGFARSGSLAEREVISDADWRDLSSIVQRLATVKRGLASEGHAADLLAELHRLAADSKVAKEILDLV